MLVVKFIPSVSKFHILLNLNLSFELSFFFGLGLFCPAILKVSTNYAVLEGPFLPRVHQSPKK